MNIKIAIIFIGILALSGAAVYSANLKQEPTEFYTGHMHIDGETVDAPQHSGGTNSAGCHNASVPYHCH